VEPGSHHPEQEPDSGRDEAEEARWVARRKPLVHASRAARLGASFIDGILALGVLLPLERAAGVLRGFPGGLEETPKPTPLQTVVWSVAGLVVFVLLHGYFLKKNGQTIGKRLVRIRIASADNGATPPLDRLLTWRVLPTQLVVLVPYVGPLALLLDALFIFRPDHRCLHDHLARTIVVRAD
jgi:uncharacterized RDD family membrane protein YckC